ncbi:RsmF rRNA methyltransferase first C-terminal domain-containing protein [Streptococcus sp. SGI.013]|uniref:RsmF rRNA methyltransferase first C-terminal domain-containing protein n=1 Tax=unclassified Streptococcus TaxID=2608887 RepID=UPI003D02F9EE
MKLPDTFIKKYQQLLGDEAEAFFKTFDQEAISAFRINPLKANIKKFDTPINNMPWSYYGKVSGKSSDHVTGLVYSQEPAAQMVAQVASPKKGMKVLDLAAAPGGKTTHLLSYLDNTGILVSNEINHKRSKILVENVERFGARNVVITNESATRLAKVFPNYFDLIVLDAPCSGEGMFRKDPAAIQYWNEDYPSQCAKVQQEILRDALDMLAPGGSIVYSTCTWSPEENEDIVRWLMEIDHNLSLEMIPKENGMVSGINMPEVARMYPHCFKGEGQFVAKLRDTQTHQTSSKLKSARTNLTREQAQLWEEFYRRKVNTDLSGVLQVFGEQLYLLPNHLPDLSQLKIARNGLHLGTFKKKRFEPSFALGLALHPDEVDQVIEMTQEDFKKYVSGQTVSLPKSYANDWYYIAIEGNGIGFAKVVDKTLKNAFPKGLRFS